MDSLIEDKNVSSSVALASRIKTAFPDDAQLQIHADAKIAALQGGSQSQLAIYSARFSPLWPEGLRSEYYHALAETHQLRAFLADARTAIAAHPAALDPVLRTYFYYEQENRRDLADRQLLELESRRTGASAAWSADDLKTVAPLFERVQDYDEAAHCYYLIYDLPAADAAAKEFALAGLISLLLDVPEQQIHFGQRDLSLYKNIAQLDRHPGFLNGILSLILNSTLPGYQYQSASASAAAYFHRASAARLIERMRREFPSSPRVPQLEAKLFAAYAVYGQHDAIIRLVPDWLEHNPNSPEYVNTALLLASSYAASVRTQDELALYDRLLTKLSDESEHMPIGVRGIIADTQPDRSRPDAGVSGSGARSPDYARVLDIYIGRLVYLNRQTAAIALFRREVGHNPDDPGLYQRLALFVEQNRLDGDLEQTYKQALARFADTSWAAKLARFYLRRKEYGAYENLARQITQTFKGSDVATFVTAVRPNRDLNPVLYRQINLYAHQRFPHNIVFIHNLLHAYRRQPTYDLAAYDALLRETWTYDTELRTVFFEYLTSTGKLHDELAALPAVETAAADRNTVALQFYAEGHAWLSEYESAAPAFVQIADLAPGEHDSNTRAVSIERSLASAVPAAFERAVQLAQNDVKADPGNRGVITLIGELYADREQYPQARRWWDRLASVRPGLAEGYLGSATVFWDYFQFRDALRIIGDARNKLHAPARFGYEAGAIYENQGHYSKAVAEYIGAALHDRSDQARARLIRLAKRSSTAALVEQRTASLTSAGFDQSAFELRLSVLEAENRRTELHDLLAQLLPRAADASQVEAVRSAADRLGFDEISSECLNHLVTLAADPVEKIQARFELARFYETHDNTHGAEQEYSALLSDQPNILGIVRANVDFYSRQKQLPKAVAILEAASDRAQLPYRNDFRREAAQKAADSGAYDEARKLLESLLAADPYNGDLLAQKAQTYAAQGDDAGLIQFYAQQVKAMQAAPVPADQKVTHLAALRRGYVAALIKAKKWSDALAQYQQLLNGYPEDVPLAAEVARFAEAHALAATLTAYYEKATHDSPRDYRWPLVLARVDTQLRHYPDAIAAYDKAAYVRPDRSDIFVAKADLELRLLRFEDAIKSYQKLYELTYHDTQYLADQAGAYMRQNNRAEALRLLRAAYIDPHPNEPWPYITVMRQLLAWKLFDDANRVYSEARPLFTTDGNSTREAVSLDLQALISLHRPADALAVVATVVREQAQSSAQREIVTSDYARAIGEAVRDYLTPEEKSAFAEQIEKPGALPPSFDLYALANSAGLWDIAARQLVLKMQAHPEQVWQWQSQLEQLQRSRLRYYELGKDLESAAPPQGSARRQQVLASAMEAYRTAGDTASQLRLALNSNIGIQPEEYARLFVSSGADIKTRLAVLARRNPERANAVVQHLIAKGDPDAAVQAISARGTRISPLWINSYRALAALYFLSPEKWATDAFDAILGPRTIAGELSNSSPQTSLRGDTWFYYGARYGDYLGYRNLTDIEDYLPASIEANPAASNSYLELGDSYHSLKQPARAADLYRYALQLTPNRADAHDRLAVLAIEGNDRAAAITEWREALRILADRIEQGPLPPDYWTSAQTLLEHANEYKVISQLRPDADAMLRSYIKRNNDYNFQPFVYGILKDAPDERAALAWLVELSRLPNMRSILDDVLQVAQVPPAERDSIYREKIERDRSAVTSSAGEAAVQAREVLKSDLIGYANYLDGQEREADAWTVLQQIEATARPAETTLAIGARSGHMDELLNSYEVEPERAPTGERMLSIASRLENDGHHDLAIRLREFEYGRELNGSNPAASAYFGMAEVRFDQKRNPEALNLIRDVTLSVGAPFENLPEAVRILERAGLRDDAVRYATEWQTAEPWNDAAQSAVARLKHDATRNTAPAARITDAERVQQLSAAIADDPQLMDPRLDLAEAAFRRSQDALGLAAFNSYQPPDTADAKFMRVQELAAAAMVRREDFGQAIAAYDQLLANTKDTAKHAEIQRLRDAAQNTVSLQAANAARAPVVTAEVQQSVIVRPKLKSLPIEESRP